jgi:hypothetical protein
LTFEHPDRQRQAHRDDAQLAELDADVEEQQCADQIIAQAPVA